jgi:multidrug efflux pump subunit AcrA (membrane-fusion protein)
MIGKLMLPVVALGMAAYATNYVISTHPAAAPSKFAARPIEAPYSQTLCGVGVIEAATENIAVGSAMPGTVVELMVSVNQEVKAGDALLRLDDRELRAQLKIREAGLIVSNEKLSRLESLPRTEELPAKSQKVRECRAQVEYHSDNLKRISDLLKTKALAITEYESARRSLRVAEAQLATAQSEYALLEAGAWQPDRALAEAEIAFAKAELEKTQCDIDRLTVRAPIAGRILKMNVRLGEYVATPSPFPLLLMGQTDPLHVRVEIDDRDLDRLILGARATAVVRGRSRRRFPLVFVRAEPYVVPKSELTGHPLEQVDTRVLQVIYRIGGSTEMLYVGQELDVFIEAALDKAHTENGGR